jgi:signal transduction histidine kinase/CheY-like chemotaxis protein
MTGIVDVLEGLDRPAAVMAADGVLVCANEAWRKSEPPAHLLARLGSGGRLEADGGLVWTVRALPGGERLMLAEPAVVQGLHGRERYLAALSHELRTPLSGVIGMAGLLADTPLNADQRTYVQALRQTGAHLLGLVNDVLDLAKLESGQIDLEPAPLDIELLLQGVCELLSPRAHEKGLEIAWAATGCPARIMADEGRLRQILFNLAGNAVKFTEQGGVLILAEAMGEEDGETTLRFSVRDTGPGVPSHEQARIFEEYVRAPGHTARLEGTGLGLAIVRRLATAHDGAIGLDSPAEGGAEFWFQARFPIAVAAPARRPLEGLTVLVVSPSVIVRTAAAAQIEASGGRARVCERAPEDLEADLVLLDRALAQAPPPARPTLVLLKPERRGELESLRARGFAGYLIKPLRRASLAERILAAVGRGAQAAEPARPAEDDRLAPACAAGVRVLLAEDNPINALLARTLLEREGCAVDCVVNGLDALEAGKNGTHDLILMDQRMPGMDGVQAAKALRAAGVKTPIVALTADAFEDDRKACLNAGMNDFLAKPLEAGALRGVLGRWARPQAPATQAPAAFTPEGQQDKLAS